MSGQPFTPGFSTSDGADITGSGTGSAGDSARPDVTCDPNSGFTRDFYHQFNTACFARPARGTFGTSGVYNMRNPSWTNWDMSLSKRIPWKEQRYFQFRGEFYNLPNHSEFNGYDAGIRFNAQGQQINANLGALSGTRDPRKIQLSLRVMF